MTVLDVILVGGGLLILLAIVMVARRRSTHSHPGLSPSSDHLMVAEEELNLLKGGSLWGDVYQPRLVTGRRLRRRRSGSPFD